MRALMRLWRRVDALLACVPYALIALLARISVAGVFWRSGQTKVSGLQIDLAEGRFQLGVPRVTDSAVFLFEEEYKVPVLSPELAATLAAIAEHVFPVLLLIGLATRLSALALLGMTLVIQLFVYPDAFPVHGVWAACLMFLMAYGAGPLSVDQLIFGRRPLAGGVPSARR